MLNKSAAAVLRALWRSEGLTRRELTLALDLSRPTVDKAVKELLELE
ncbi:TPA: winged helix-turn-helix transcriptional regulator, partial [Candidatus Bipolaricaulota bacterium]|nr:winged helix-turn-helix transcriptional regulator [Candidatus Bipolaricaulota bacterium]